MVEEMKTISAYIFGWISGTIVSVFLAMTYASYTLADLRNLVVDIIGRSLAMLLEFTPFLVLLGILFVVIQFFLFFQTYKIRLVKK